MAQRLSDEQRARIEGRLTPTAMDFGAYVRTDVTALLRHAQWADERIQELENTIAEQKETIYRGGWEEGGVRRENRDLRHVTKVTRRMVDAYRVDLEARDERVRELEEALKGADWVIRKLAQYEGFAQSHGWVASAEDIAKGREYRQMIDAALRSGEPSR